MASLDTGVDLTKLRARVVENPREAMDGVISFLRDHSFSSGLHIRGVLELKAARSSSADWQHLGELLLGLLDQAQNEMDVLSDEEIKTTQTRLAVRDALQDRKIDNRVAFACEGLGKEYPEFRLRDVNLKLRLGEITGVVGENANGKTTLFRLMVGEIKPSHGQMTFPELGENRADKINWSNVHMGMAYVPQTLTPWPGSLEENLRFAAASRGVLGKANDRAFEYIVERLDLRDYLARPWAQLSGGYQLRFELARALIWRPKVLVLDEPLANLDFRAQWKLLRDVRRMSRSFSDPISVIISSQHLHEIEALADNILFLRSGDVEFNGPRDQIGEDRKQNTFELICDAPLNQVLSDRIGLGVQTVRYDGMTYIVTTDVEFTGKHLLETLVGDGCAPRYFRDISRSVKQLFDPAQS